MVSKVDVPLSKHLLNIMKRSKADLTKILLSKYNCDVTISGDDKMTEKRFEMTLDSGVVVSVWKADLTNFPVDVVVNAANENLKHIGGLAYVLSKAGGPRIQQDSEDYVRTHGSVVTGSAVMMDAGSLPCKKIIHAVGPRLSGHFSQSDLNIAKQLLGQTVVSIIDLVEKNGLRTVAIPAISSGIFNFPLHECAETIVRSLSYARHVKEIQLVNNDEPTVRAMELACRGELEKYQHTRGASSRFKANTKKTSGSVQFGNVHVMVKRGFIEDEQTDVIVNTTSRTHWTGGLVSKAILNKAGYGMEKELKKASSDDLVVTTRAYNLNCKQVYHILWPTSPEYCHSDEFLGTLKFAVLHCLQMASKSHRSISFPAIGTGNQNLGKRAVARVMSEAVTEFMADQPPRLDVYFVIQQEDTFKTFEEELSRAQQTTTRENFLHGPVKRDEHTSSRVSSPHISLTGTSDEAQQEARHWLSQLLSGSNESRVSVCNNFILHFGETEQKQLRQIAIGGVSVEESFDGRQATITVKGTSSEDVAVAALQVEAMLCNTVDEFVRDEERQLSASAERLHFKRRALSLLDPECLKAVETLRDMGQNPVKVEEVFNPTLRQSFDHLKHLLACSAPRKMFQCVPAHFCDVVCRVGFNAECAPPDEQEHGEGIYFAGTVQKALEVWKLPSQKYVYIVEAEVLTGNSTPGRSDFVVPPLLDTNPASRYHSVSARPDVSVIFDGCQALPTKIITCKLFL